MSVPRNILFTIFTTALALAMTLPVKHSQIIPRQDSNPIGGMFGGSGATLLSAWENVNTYNGPASLDIPFCGTGKSYDNISNDWLLFIPNDSQWDANGVGCGNGFLNGMRNNCGAVTDWQCNLVGENGTTAAMFFNTDITCSPSSGFSAIQGNTDNSFPGIQCIGNPPSPSGNQGDGLGGTGTQTDPAPAAQSGTPELPPGLLGEPLIM